MRLSFIAAILIAIAATLPIQARAQTPDPQPAQTADAQTTADDVGVVASVQGNPTATRDNVSRPLKVQDPIYKGDLLRTGANAALGITFDDETTFNLSANASITVDAFVYEQGGKNNSALFKIARGTVAFAAHEVARTGDMKITTPTSSLGIRGTSGVVEVPAPGATGEVAVKLYADQDGRVGRIELFGAGGGPRLGLLTQAASGFAVRPGVGGRFTAVALTISPLQAARDRGFVQRAFAARTIGRQMVIQRRNLRSPGGQQRQQNLRQQQGPRQPGVNRPGLNQPRPNQPGLNRPGLNQPRLRQPGQQQPDIRQPGVPRPAAAPPRGPGLRNAPNLQRNPGLRALPPAPGQRRPARGNRNDNERPPR